jgi:NifU-like protein involved in Fe-S cluster formation
MYSPQLLDHFRNPRHAGDAGEGALVVETSNPVCGDTLRLSVRWEGSAAAEVRFRAKGCTACLAAGSALAEVMTGREAAAWRTFRKDEVEAALGEMNAASRHVLVLCQDAVRAMVAAFDAREG